MAINWPEGSQNFPSWNHQQVYRSTPVVVSNTSTWNDCGLSISNITIQQTDPTIYYWIDLSIEVDGEGTGHGITKVLYSINNGSWTTHQVFNTTGQANDSISTGHSSYHSPSVNTGGTIKYKVEYLRNGSGGSNHTIADTGPGYSPIARFMVVELENN